MSFALVVPILGQQLTAACQRESVAIAGRKAVTIGGRIAAPLPAFNQAIVNAIRQWEFEPTRVDDVAVPVCVTVAIAIDWM